MLIHRATKNRWVSRHQAAGAWGRTDEALPPLEALNRAESPPPSSGLTVGAADSGKKSTKAIEVLQSSPKGEQGR